MARGVIDEAIPYVLESDRDSPEEEQTTWHIRMRSSKDVTKTIVQFAAAEKMGRGGYRDLDESRYNKADLNTFLSIVEKVENFVFGIPSPDGVHSKYEQDGLGETFDADGRKWIKVKLIEGIDLKAVWKCLSIQDMNDLLVASNDYNRLSESSKKV